MSTTFTEFVTLEKQSCGQCGGLFALNLEFLEHARKNKGGYHCPYCDTRWSWNESEADRLRAQLEEKERLLTVAKCAEANERSAKETAEKKLRRTCTRVKAGVCPCCNRTVKQLAAHMATKHPNYGPHA